MNSNTTVYKASNDSSRLIAVKIITQLINQNGSLSSLLEKLNKQDSLEKKALVQALCFGVCRHYHELSAIANNFLKKPLRKKDHDIYSLLLVGIYQLSFMRMPDYAVVNECVATCKKLKKIWAKNLINAVLRSTIRETEAIQKLLESSLESKYSHPLWLIKLLQEYWPENYSDLLKANNQQAPMTLRVNCSTTSTEGYQQQLSQLNIDASRGDLAPHSLILKKPVSVDLLPGFQAGDVSIQDEASQMAAIILNPKKGERILDACSAPGGKTCALLELAPGAKVYAVDNDQSRLAKVSDNLKRIKASAELSCADIIQQAYAWQQAQHNFDRILLDVPCSASGVIRRHPDIKILRQPENIQELVKLQSKILDAVWPLLSMGGHLLYSTCSVLKSENSYQIEEFLARTPDAKELTINLDFSIACSHGRQLFPTTGSYDGFYYALLQKC